MDDSSVRRFKAGQLLFAPGTPGDSAFLLVVGRVQLTGPGTAADDLLGPGDVAGEVGLRTGGPHRIGAVVVEPVEACAVARETLAETADRPRTRLGAEAEDPRASRGWSRLLLVP